LILAEKYSIVYARAVRVLILICKVDRIDINESIRAPELRVIGPEGENLGILKTREALDKARSLMLDLIVISPKAKPPVAKITDYGKYKYEQKRKSRELKSKAKVVETKNIQVKIGTGENDLLRKAKQVAAWIHEGHRVKVDLFLWGRYKYMEFEFLKERLEKFLAIIPESFKIADEIKKGPKGLTVTLEKSKTKNN
jgi:translation initiation factor IF-3